MTLCSVTETGPAVLRAAPSELTTIRDGYGVAAPSRAAGWNGDRMWIGFRAAIGLLASIRQTAAWPRVAELPFERDT